MKFTSLPRTHYRFKSLPDTRFVEAVVSARQRREFLPI
jgi:hypothetical protein